MDYNDFELRAWQIDETHIGVLVHSSPAGDMRQPVTVEIEPDAICAIAERFSPSEWYRHFDGSAEVVDMGRQLADILLPMPIYTMLVRSQERIGAGDGLRIRLCLDDNLMDTPWELLYRPDQPDAALTGFLALDPQISLVREAPVKPLKARASHQKQRMVFAGTFWPNGEDRWGVREEYRHLTAALEPVKEFLAIEFIDAKDDAIENALNTPAAIFHYSGHTDVFQQRAYLVRELQASGSGVTPDPLYCEALGVALRKAGTRIAVLSACNSGRWCVVRPLLQAGLPALIGVQGLITTVAADAFSQQLYTYLAVGLSLDEAVYSARLHLLDLDIYRQAPACALAAYLVYMPSKDPVLIPRPKTRAVQEKQRAVRADRRQIVIQVTQNIGSVAGGQVVGVEVDELTTQAGETADDER